MSYSKTLKITALAITGFIAATNGSTAQNNYIEIMGTKWAKGNLQYDLTASQSGTFFQANWKIADEQWEYFEHSTGEEAKSITATDSQRDHFNWGVVNGKALSTTNYATALQNSGNFDTFDLSGKLYTNASCTSEYTGSDKFTNASVQYGDLAYWASRGQYRMPSKSEIVNLTTYASYQYGWVQVGTDDRVYGFLFKQPNGTRVCNTTAVEITESMLEEGLFLPLAGRGTVNVDYMGERGFYVFSGAFKNGSSNIIFSNEVTDLKLYKASAPQFSSWTPDYGFSIRPVANFTSGDVNDDGTVDVEDVVLTINYVVSSVSYINLNAADINESGNIDVEDIIAIINLIVK